MQIQITPLKSNKDFQVACHCLSQNQYRDGFNRFKQLISSTPEYLPSILTYIYKKINRHYSDIPLRVCLSDLYIFTSKYNDAVEELEDIIELDPHFSQAYHLLAKIYHQQQCQDKIKAIFETAFEQQIYDTAILDILPKIYLESKDIEKSIVIYNKLIENDPQHYQNYQLLAELYKRNKQYLQAIRTYLNALPISPNSLTNIITFVEDILRNCPSNYEIHQQLISLYFQACEPQKAVKQVKLLCDKDSSFVPESIRLLKEALNTFPHNQPLLFTLALFSYQSKQFTQSISYLNQLFDHLNRFDDDCQQLLKQVMDAEPKQHLGLSLQIKVALKAGDLNTTFTCIDTLLSLNEPLEEPLLEQIKQIPDKHPEKSTHCQFFLAHHEYNKNEHLACIQICQRLLNSEKDLDARILLIKTHQRQSDTGSALIALQDAISTYPSHWPLHQLLKQNKLKQINDTLDHHLNPTSSPPISPLIIGLLHLRKGDMYAAIEQFQHIEPSDNIHQQAQLLVSRCFIELGRFDLVSTQLNRILPHIAKNHPLYDLCQHYHYANLFFHGAHEDMQLQLSKLPEKSAPLNRTLSVINTHCQLNSPLRTLSAIQTPDSTQLIPIACMYKDPVSTETDQQNIISLADPHNNKGILQLFAQEYELAQEEFQIAAQLNPNIANIINNQGILSLLKGNISTAKQELENAHELAPTSINIQLNLALINTQLGQYDTAIKQLQKILETQPHHHLAYLQLGDLYAQKEQPKLAGIYWMKASENPCFNLFIHRRIHYLDPESYHPQSWTSTPKDDIKQLFK